MLEFYGGLRKPPGGKDLGRNEEGRTYTIFTDSQVAAERVCHDGCGPPQVLEKATIELARDIHERGSSVTVRWTPARAGVEGNEHAGFTAKRAAEGRGRRARSEYLSEASLSHFTRKTTEARSKATRGRIRGHVKSERRYRPPPGGKLYKGLGKVRKELASRFYELLSGHAATGEHPTRIGQAPSSECWWCGSGERQTHYHLFVKCRRWTPEIRKLWERASSVRLLFQDERAIPAFLDFLRDTKVGRMPGLAHFGVEVEEKLEVIEVWSRAGEEGWNGVEGEEGGPGPP